MKWIAIFLLLVFGSELSAQTTVTTKPYVSKVWVADQGNGTYKNPMLNADYSDPDAIRVGDDYYMISSSFEDVPGLPILHSKDLVNWTIIGHALNGSLLLNIFPYPDTAMVFGRLPSGITTVNFISIIPILILEFI